MAFGIIYLITNTVDGMRYVGQTQNSLVIRWSGHKSDSKVFSRNFFHRAIRKYGFDAFLKEEIDNAESLQELNYKETFHIINLNTLAPNGYNLTLGGDTVEFSEETRNRISTSIKVRCIRGHLFTPENTYTRPKTGGRKCRQCQKNWVEEKRAKRVGEEILSVPNRDKVACIRGHAFTLENTYIAKTGSRKCKKCMNDQIREKRQRQKHVILSAN
jgi:group I intron endonuclease